jgi:tetratricopeptide (TPR) repeat protein
MDVDRARSANSAVTMRRSCTPTRATRLLPQLLQKRDPSGLAVPQREHVITRECYSRDGRASTVPGADARSMRSTGAMNRQEAMDVLTLAEAAMPGRSGSDEAREAALRAVGDRVVPALEYLERADPAAALRLCGALSIFWQDTGRVAEGRAITDRLVDEFMLKAVDNAAIAAAIPRALLVSSELAFRQGDQKAATKRANATVRAAVLVEDRVTASLAYTNLARVAYRAGDAAEIERYSRRAQEFAGDDSLAQRAALHMLAWAAHTAGDLDEAEKRFEESLELRRRTAGRLSVAAESANLGDLAAERGNYPRAARLLGDALEVSHEIGSMYMLVNTLPSIAVLAVRAGLDEPAARLFGAATALASRSGLIPDPNDSVDEARSNLRERLGKDGLERLDREGERMSDDDAVALAMEIANRLKSRSQPDDLRTRGRPSP